MTTESISDPILKEDKRTVFIPDPLSSHPLAKKHEGETDEDYTARLEYLDLTSDLIRHPKP